MAPPALIDQQSPATPWIDFPGVWKACCMPEGATPRVLENTTATTHLLDSEKGQSLFVWTRLCPVAKTAPATAGGVANDRVRRRVVARIALCIPYITNQVEVTGIGTGKEDGDVKTHSCTPHR